MVLEFNPADRGGKATSLSTQKPGDAKDQQSASFETAKNGMAQSGPQRVPQGTDIRVRAFGFSNARARQPKAMQTLGRDMSPERAVREFGKDFAEVVNFDSYVNLKVRFDHPNFPEEFVIRASSSPGDSLSDFLKTIQNNKISKQIPET